MAGSSVCRRWSTLPYVHLDMEGGPSSLRPQSVDVEDDRKGSHFAQEFNWSINEDHQEFVIRITRKPEAVHAVNVAVKIDRAILEQPDESMGFDGGVRNGNGVSTIGFTFKLFQESVFNGVVEPELKKTAKECDKCKDYIHRSLHYHCTKCEAPCPKCGAMVFNGGIRNGNEVSTLRSTFKISQEFVSKEVVELEKEKTTEECDKCKDYVHRGLHYHCTKCEAPCLKCEYANREPNSSQTWTNQAYWDPNSYQIWTDDGEVIYWDDVNSQHAFQEPLEIGALLDMQHQMVINTGLLSRSANEAAEARTGPNNWPGHGTFCSQTLGCNPCICRKCCESRERYGNYPCFCSSCCSSMVKEPF